MATQLLIYESAVPVSYTRHGEYFVEIGNDYNFTRGINAVPVLAVEIPNAAAEYCVVFAGDGNVLTATALLGLHAQENLYVASDGSWQAKYIPAFVRRYPFVFSSQDDGKTFTLCIDESYKGFGREGRGQRLFGEDRKPTPFVDNVLKFLEQYQIQFQRTQAFCRKLQDLGLLEAMRAQVSLEGGERISLTGFQVVNRERVKALAADKLAELAKTGELELLYLHLHSMRNFGGMRERLTTGYGTSGKGGGEAEAAAAAPDTQAADKKAVADKGKPRQGEKPD